MPFIMSKTNLPVTLHQEQALKAGLGRAIELIPGMTESSLMVGVEGNAHLYLRGDNSQPMAFITVAVFNNPGHVGYEALSMAIAQLFHETLSIASARIYIKYEDISTWSVAGLTFSNRE